MGWRDTDEDSSAVKSARPPSPSAVGAALVALPRALFDGTRSLLAVYRPLSKSAIPGLELKNVRLFDGGDEVVGCLGHPGIRVGEGCERMW